MVARRWGGGLVAVTMFALVVGSPAAAHTAGFDDVTDGVYYSTPVADLAEAGVFDGTVCEAGFCPDEAIDRKTMAVWVVRILDGQDPPSISESSFDDVVANSFHAPFIERMIELGVTRGCGDGSTYCPDDRVTRAQMAAFISRAFDLPDGPWPNFTDVPQNAWYAVNVAQLAASGITKGCGDGSTFCPGSETTRAQMATFLHRAENPGTPPDPTTETDDAETTETELYSEDDEPVPGLIRGALTKGTVPVHVYYCARQGRYSTKDLAEVVDLLIDVISPRWMRESSDLQTLVFTEGSVISPDLAWDSVWLEEAYPRCRAALGSDRPSQILILVDTPRGRHHGYGGGGVAISMTRDALGLEGHGEKRFLFVVAHELGHSLTGLRHDFVSCLWDTLMVGIGTSACKPGAGGAVLGDLDLVPTNLIYPLFVGEGLLLSCYHRRLLGWPVGGDSPPCVLLPPSPPTSVSLSESGLTVSWKPPLFTDDVPITGYEVTVHSRVLDGVYGVYELSENDRMFPIDGLPILDDYWILVRAISKYGTGALEDLDFKSIPSPDSVSVTEVASGRFEVSWSPVPGASFYWVWDNVINNDDITGTTYRETNDTSIVIREDVPGTLHTVKVLACGFEDVFGWEECGFGTEVTVSAASRLPAEPARPAGPASVSVIEAGDDWFVLSWEPVPGATSYYCGYRIGDGMGTGRYTSDSPCELWLDDPKAGITYTVEVAACLEESDLCGEATTATASTRVLPPAPASYPVSVKEVGDTWFTLSWDPPAADAYFDVKAVVGNVRWRAPGWTRDLNGNWGLEPDTDYTLKVRTCHGTESNCGGWVTFSFTTTPHN